MFMRVADQLLIYCFMHHLKIEIRSSILKIWKLLGKHTACLFEGLRMAPRKLIILFTQPNKYLETVAANAKWTKIFLFVAVNVAHLTVKDYDFKRFS
jgi:hypothetical protein